VMPKTCVIKGCKSLGSGSTEKRCEGVTFHRFPIDPAVKQKWLENIDRINKDGSAWQPYKAATICSLHFKPSCFHESKGKGTIVPSSVSSVTPVIKRRRVLYPKAIPTENLGCSHHHSQARLLAHPNALPLPRGNIKSYTENYLAGLARRKNKAGAGGLGPSIPSMGIHKNADLQIIEALGISRKFWAKLSDSEREEQRNFHLNISHSFLEHSYSSSTMAGAERLADDNKRLRMLVEKLVHKVEQDRTKYVRVQNSLAKACLMLEQCSQYEFYDAEGTKISKPKSKLAKKLSAVTKMGAVKVKEESTAGESQAFPMTPQEYQAAIKKFARSAGRGKLGSSKQGGRKSGLKLKDVDSLRNLKLDEESEGQDGYYVLDDADLMLMSEAQQSTQAKQESQAAIDNPIDSGGVEYYYQVDPSVTTLALQNIADPMQGQNMDRYKDPTGVVLEETQTEKNQGEQIRYVIEYQDENHSTHLPHTIVSAADTGGETGIAPGTLEYYAPLVHSETGDVTVQQENAESASSLVTMTPDGANIGDATQPYLTIDPSMLITSAPAGMEGVTGVEVFSEGGGVEAGTTIHALEVEEEGEEAANSAAGHDESAAAAVAAAVEGTAAAQELQEINIGGFKYIYQVMDNDPAEMEDAVME